MFLTDGKISNGVNLLKGKKIADKILKDLKKAIIKEKIKPGLAVVLVGKNKASEVYVGLKKKAAKAIGINFYLYKFQASRKESAVIQKIKELNENKKIHGIIVQLPLPKKFSTQKIINVIKIQKDADGFSIKDEPALVGHSRPVFPTAIMKLLESTKINLKNKKAIVIANSKEFGKIMEAALKKKKIKADYILVGSIKNNLLKIKQADVVISAVGKPGLVTGEMIKKGAVIIDGGITKIGQKVSGDVDFESVRNKAAYLSPVPGGVGPVTIACLLENVWLLAKQKSR
jgi:methylenetetrahydrofolate dehydrogenase (NADP+)/methenyltetrahydrofolate cyclohydrolase